MTPTATSGADESALFDALCELPPAEQDRCLKSTAMSFEEYRREAAAARAPR